MLYVTLQMQHLTFQVVAISGYTGISASKQAPNFAIYPTLPWSGS